MKRPVFWLSIACCVVFGTFWALRTAAYSEEPPRTASSETAKPATVKVEAGPIVVETTLKGTIEAENVTELFLDLKSWTEPLIVKSAAAHGSRVKKGDIVLELDTVKIDQTLHEVRVERELADISLRLAKEEFSILDQSLPMNLAEADREKQVAEENLKRYAEVERDHEKKSGEFMMKSAANWLEYAREELKQLKKMYRDKDLTEETEEIILKRQQNEIEQFEFMIESMRLHLERDEALEQPRRGQAMKDAVQKQTLAWQKAQSSLPLELHQKKLALQKQEIERAKTEERLEHLKVDRAAMIVHAPSDGIVYHGQSDRGHWNSATVSTQLRHNGTIQLKEIVMTIVSARPVFLRADVEEKDLHALKEGLEGHAVPVGFPSLKLVAHLKHLSLVPRTAGSFESQIAVDIPDTVETIFPGMAANVKFITYRQDNALQVASSAIFHDEGSDVHYVFVAGEGKPVKTSVEVGKASGEKTEILKGLQAGTEILAAKP